MRSIQCFDGFVKVKESKECTFNIKLLFKCSFNVILKCICFRLDIWFLTNFVFSFFLPTKVYVSMMTFSMSEFQHQTSIVINQVKICYLFLYKICYAVSVYVLRLSIFRYEFRSILRKKRHSYLQDLLKLRLLGWGPYWYWIAFKCTYRYWYRFPVLLIEGSTQNWTWHWQPLVCIQFAGRRRWIRCP